MKTIPTLQKLQDWLLNIHLEFAPYVKNQLDAATHFKESQKTSGHLEKFCRKFSARNKKTYFMKCNQRIFPSDYCPRISLNWEKSLEWEAGKTKSHQHTIYFWPKRLTPLLLCLHLYWWNTTRIMFPVNYYGCGPGSPLINMYRHAVQQWITCLFLNNPNSPPPKRHKITFFP